MFIKKKKINRSDLIPTFSIFQSSFSSAHVYSAEESGNEYFIRFDFSRFYLHFVANVKILKCFLTKSKMKSQDAKVHWICIDTDFSW